ncbi:ketopantoate reductase family protein [Roseomonas terrae]|uniref:2-dehydropantoate 2-reductase n=1 Tax=Neoroseomonas terrae TaxID=424799 RepID=A0ABS5EGG1_9PROT|nr:ketopantoate reductase family protein [Neoroseomonas terrae]MBR0650087.1 ketopantoate reductase family protein [Neoroseomonas terrae]
MNESARTDTAPLLIIGGGAVGGYIAAHLTRLGETVVLWEPWAPNREAIAASGFAVSEPSGDFVAHPGLIAAAAEVPALAPRLTILCSKLADAPAIVAEVERHWRGTWLVTLNALADIAMAEELGAERVLGCIVTGFFANLTRPGAMQRHRARGDGGPALFRVGETAGPATPRVHAIVDLLGGIDKAEAVDDMTAARWTKLAFNCMTSALSALNRRPIRDLFLEPTLRQEMLAVALEVVSVAAVGAVRLDPVCGIAGDTWKAAATGNAVKRAEVEAGLIRYGAHMNATAISGMAQDLSRGRRTEVSLINGVVVDHARRHGVPVPANDALIARLEALTPT